MNTYPSRLYDILMYGGAILIILSIVCIIFAMTILYKWHRMITLGKNTIQSIGNSMLIPIVSILGVIREVIKKPTKSN